MKYWLGAALTSAAIYLASQAWAHRAKVIAARQQAIRRGLPIERPIDAKSIAAFGEMVTPMVHLALIYAALKITFAFYVFNDGTLSVFDLAGALVLMASYGLWLQSKTAYRMPPHAVAAESFTADNHEILASVPAGAAPLLATAVAASAEPDFGLDVVAHPRPISVRPAARVKLPNQYSPSISSAARAGQQTSASESLR